jgi:H+-transporting ATPase
MDLQVRLNPSSTPPVCTADRIAATMQLLFFFFIAVFALPPQVSTQPIAQAPAASHAHTLVHTLLLTTAATLPLQDYFCKGLVDMPADDIVKFCPKYEPGMIIKNISCPNCPSFFQLPVLLLMLITLLNDGTLISIGYDNVVPSNRPEKWNLRVRNVANALLGGFSW